MIQLVPAAYSTVLQYSISAPREMGYTRFGRRRILAGEKLVHTVLEYVCMVSYIAREWINRVRLPILLEVS